MGLDLTKAIVIVVNEKQDNSRYLETLEKRVNKKTIK